MVKDSWVYCPICNNKTRTKIRPDTVARNLPLFAENVGRGKTGGYGKIEA